MPKTISRPLLLASLLAPILLCACAPPHMALSPELADQGEELDVKGANGYLIFIEQVLHFGPYRVDHVQRGWIRGSKTTEDDYSSQKQRQHYSFMLESNQGKPWRCECEQKLASEDLTHPMGMGISVGETLDEHHSLVCNFQAPDSAAIWTLSLTRGMSDSSQGVLTSGGRSLRVESIHEIREAHVPVLVDAVGYRFRNEQGDVAAVETSYEKKIWFGAGAADLRAPLAAAASALLLREEIHKKD